MHKVRTVFALYQTMTWVYGRKISRCDIKEGIRQIPDIHISRSSSSESISPFQTQNVFCIYILSFHFTFQDIILSGLSFFLQTCYLQVSVAFSTACLWQETKLFASPLSLSGDANKRACKLCLFPHEKRSLKQTGSAMKIKEYESTGCCKDCLASKAEWQCPLNQQTLTMDITQPRLSRQCLFGCFFPIILITCSNAWTETEIFLDLAYF